MSQGLQDEAKRLNDWLDEWSFEPNVELEVRISGWGSLHLMLRTKVEDTYNPGNIITVVSQSILPPGREWDRAGFQRFVRGVRHYWAKHESDEWFKDRATGKPIFDPHSPLIFESFMP